MGPTGTSGATDPNAPFLTTGAAGAAPSPSNAPNPIYNVAGNEYPLAPTQPTTQAPAPTQTTQPTTPSTGGGGGNGGNNNGAVGYSPSFNGQTVSVNGQTYQSVNGAWVAQASQPGGNNIDFDALIKPALDALNAFIPIAQQGYTNTVNQANTWGTNQNQQIQDSMTAQNQTLNETKAQEDTQTQNAQQQARQMAAEIQQGIQARYGGTTGTGAFASELGGRQASQSISQLQQGLQQVHMQIADKLQQVQAVGSTALQNISDQVKASIDNAQQTLDSNLAQIRQQEGTLQSQKAQMAATAMQHYQDTVNQINQFNAQQQNTVLLQQQQAESQLKVAQTHLQAYGSFQPTTPTATAQTNPIGSTGATGTTTTTGGQLTPQQYQQMLANSQGGQQTNTNQNPLQPTIQ